MSEEDLEFVRSSKRQRSYYRRKPWCRARPSVHQRKVRSLLGKISRDTTGQTGLVKHGDKAIPVVAHQVSKMMKGKKFASPPPPKIPEILEQLKPAFEAIGVQVSSMKPINSTAIPLLLQWQREEKKRKAEIISKGKRAA